MKDSLPTGKDLSARILSFLAADDDRLQAFFDTTGATPASLRMIAGTQGFDDALIDYVQGDDFRLVAFAAFCEVPPSAVAALKTSRSVIRLAQVGDVVPLHRPANGEIARRFRSL